VPVEINQSGGVLGPYWSEMHRRAVRGLHVAFQFERFRGRRCSRRTVLFGTAQVDTPESRSTAGDRMMATGQPAW
jgi:hypothetical protein